MIAEKQNQAMSPVATLMKMVIISLVDEPGQVSITEITGHASTVIEVRTAPRDLGKLVGRRGRTADALRTLLIGLSGKARRRFLLELIEPRRAVAP